MGIKETMNPLTQRLILLCLKQILCNQAGASFLVEGNLFDISELIDVTMKKVDTIQQTMLLCLKQILCNQLKGADPEKNLLALNDLIDKSLKLLE